MFRFIVWCTEHADYNTFVMSVKHGFVYPNVCNFLLLALFLQYCLFNALFALI